MMLKADWLGGPQTGSIREPLMFCQRLRRVSVSEQAHDICPHAPHHLHVLLLLFQHFPHCAQRLALHLTHFDPLR